MTEPTFEVISPGPSADGWRAIFSSGGGVSMGPLACWACSARRGDPTPAPWPAPLLPRGNVPGTRRSSWPNSPGPRVEGARSGRFIYSDGTVWHVSHHVVYVLFGHDGNGHLRPLPVGPAGPGCHGVPHPPAEGRWRLAALGQCRQSRSQMVSTSIEEDPWTG